jgi:hypothetical protein
MRVLMITVAIFFLFWSAASAQHPLGWVACEFKWQDAGKPADYQKFINDCVASQSEIAPRTEPQSSTQAGQAVWPTPAPSTLPQTRDQWEPSGPNSNLQWDQSKAIQKAKLDSAASEMGVCVRDAATIALRTGVRNREQLGSAVVSLCKAQLTLFFVAAKAANMTTDEQQRISSSLLETGMDRVLRQGQ